MTADQFNRNFPIGTLVRYWPGIRSGPGTLYLADTAGSLAIELRAVAGRVWERARRSDERIQAIMAAAETCAAALAEHQALGRFRRRGAIETLAKIRDL